MIFSRTCVLVCVIGIIFLATFVLGVIIARQVAKGINKRCTNEDIKFVSWIVSSIGFGVFVTITLCMKGII